MIRAILRFVRLPAMLLGAVVVLALAVVGLKACTTPPPAPGPAEVELGRAYDETMADGVLTVEEFARLAEAIGPAVEELRAAREAPPPQGWPDLLHMVAVIAGAVGLSVPITNAARNHNWPGTTRKPR